MHSPEIIKAIELVEFICGGTDNVGVTLSYLHGSPDLTKFNALPFSVENVSLLVSLKDNMLSIYEKTFTGNASKEEIVRFILKSGLKLAKRLRKMEEYVAEHEDQEPPIVWRKNYYCVDQLIMEPVYINQESDTKKKRKTK